MLPDQAAIILQMLSMLVLLFDGSSPVYASLREQLQNDAQKLFRH